MPSASLTIIEQKKERIEETLSLLIPDQKANTLFEAARYSLLAPSKRLRPLLTLICAETLGADPELALYPACALEMVHTYSLIHDDLPCMDDDDMRRGQPTLHKVYPEGHAVLTGDFLLTFSFEVLTRSPGLSAEQRLELVRLLSIGAGEIGMIGGQVLDLSWARSEYKPTWPELSHVLLKKTATLFATALEMGAIVANSSEIDRRLLVRIGHEIGLAFQIVDDLIDGDGAAELLGEEKAKLHVQALFKSVEETLSKLSKPSTHLHALFGKLIHRVV